jgi:hypothetical protein
VEEVYSDANIAALNEVLQERGISPDRIITILRI